MTPRRARARVFGALVAVQILFGVWPVVATIVMREMAPTALVGFRTVAGAPIVLAIVGLTSGLRMPLPDLARTAVLGFLGISFNQVAFIGGLERAGPVDTVVLIVIIPASTLLIATVLGRERPSLRRKLGIAVSMVGAWILIGAERFGFSETSVTGYLFLLASTTSYALYLVLAKPVIHRHGPVLVMTWAFAFGAILALPWTAGPMLDTPWLALSSSVKLWLVFVVAGPTIGTYFLNAYALRFLDSSIVAVFICIQPFVGWVASQMLLGENVTPRAFVSASILMIGVVLTSFGRDTPALGGRRAALASDAHDHRDR